MELTNRAEIERQIREISNPIFADVRPPDPNCLFNARLQIDSNSWDTYADGYKKAADIVIKSVVEARWYQNFLVYPTIFLYRQYLEIRLKELIRLAEVLHHREINIHQTHNLVLLWALVRPEIEAIWLNCNQHDIENLNAIEGRLQEVCSVDPSSQTFRYPETTSGAPVFSETSYINPVHLGDVLGGIAALLDGASFLMQEAIDSSHCS